MSNEMVDKSPTNFLPEFRCINRGTVGARNWRKL